MAKIITIANQKGGVGKTATANALAAVLKQKKYRVLMVDGDPQCNTTDAYRAVVDNQATLYDLMCQEGTTDEAIQHTEVGDIIACDPHLIKADNIFQQQGREYLLKEALEPVSLEYDFIIIDTSPSLGVVLLNALTAANGVIIPIGADRDSLQGLAQLTETINATRKYTNPQLQVYGLLVTIYFANTNLSKEVINNTLPEIEKMLGTKTFESKIRHTTNVKNARANRVPLIKYAPYCTASRDYEAFTEELLKRIGV